MESHISLYDERARRDVSEGQLPPLLHPVTISVDFCGPQKPLSIGSNQRATTSEVQKVSSLRHIQLFTNLNETMSSMKQEQKAGLAEGTNNFSNGKNRQIANTNLPPKHKPSHSGRNINVQEYSGWVLK